MDQLKGHFEPTFRASLPELDQILGKPFRVLEDGFVRVVDYMGSDAAIVQAARVSYGAGTKQIQEDRALIRYLLQHQHTSPFEMCEIKLHVRAPMDCWRQWIRHRTASVNEYSTRYSIAVDGAARTPPHAWRTQSTNNKQGSSDFIAEGTGSHLTAEEEEFHRHARDLYESRLSKGVAREQARKDLPLSTYTEAYWKIDLHNLMNFLRLRMDDRAQLEIRQYANTIYEEILRRWCPITYEAFRDYGLSGLILSGPEIAILRAGQASYLQARELAIALGLLKDNGADSNSTRESRDFLAKLVKLGIPVPWNEERDE